MTCFRGPFFVNLGYMNPRQLQASLWKYGAIVIFIALACVLVPPAKCQTLTLQNTAGSIVAPGEILNFPLNLSGSGGKLAGVQWTLNSSVAGTAFTVTATPGATANSTSVPCGTGPSVICVAINLTGSTNLLDGELAAVQVQLPATIAASSVTLFLSGTLGTDSTGSAVPVAASAPIVLTVGGVGGAVTFDNSADLGSFAPASTIATASYTANGSLFVQVSGLGNVSAASFGGLPLVHLGRVANNGSIDVWYLQSAVGSSPITLQTDAIARLYVMAVSYSDVSSIGTPVTSAPNLGNAVVATSVPISSSSDWLVAFTNGVSNCVSDNATVRLKSGTQGCIYDRGSLGPPPSATIDTQVNFQGPAFGNAILAVDLVAGSPAGPPPAQIWTGPICTTQAPDAPYDGSGVNQDGTRVPMIPWTWAEDPKAGTQAGQCLAYSRRKSGGWVPESCCLVTGTASVR